MQGLAQQEATQQAALFHQRAMLQALRIFLGSVALWFISQTIELSTDFILLALSLAAGVLVAGLLLQRKISFFSTLLGHLALAVGINVFLSLANAVTLGATSTSVSDFIIPLLGQHVWLCFWIYSVALLSTWAFWTREHALTAESLLGISLVIWLLSAHRNYRLDAPKEIASLTWKLEFLQNWGIEPQHLILAIGICSIFLFIWYVGFASFRPLFTKKRVIETRAHPAYRQLIFSGGTALLLLAGLTWFIHDWYSSNISRASNGVGPSAELNEGQSNLGFNSAVTATKQPAAILRLEADYPQNPNAPMLYLREGALSQFEGKELVRGSNEYNADIPHTALGEVFVAAAPPKGEEFRTPIPQSVYIISSHQAPFAIDTATRIRPLKNPNPNRFQHAYQALSLAPTLPLQQLVGNEVGNPEWDKATWDHYLRAPGSLSQDEIPGVHPDQTPLKDGYGEDLRYRQMAEFLAGGEQNPILQAAQIIRYLSEQSIYTRSPGHDVAEDGDPVAPYLFSEEKRGYCVHFAHAAVYMFRLMGIPARIATGYQTDTQYAKDGHILLMLGDRHAWPEIYIRGLGWTVFDVAPAQAENEPELVPDSDLLEQLMSELDPAPEFLESSPSAVDDERTPLDRRIALAIVFGILSLVALYVLTRKAFLYYGYRLSNNPSIRARRAYLAFAARLADLGVQRLAGETRLEFTRRLAGFSAIEGSSLARYLEQSVYPATPYQHSTAGIDAALQSCRQQTSAAFPWYRRALAACAFTSVLRARLL